MPSSIALVTHVTHSTSKMGIELVIFKVTHSGHVGVQSEALRGQTKLRFELQRHAAKQSFALNSNAMRFFKEAMCVT
jgi:hypothetical protein